MNHIKSSALYKEALTYIPGGVNSPVRAFQSVGMDPIFIDHAEGSHITDVDGNTYIDYINSWGPLILGHSNEVVTEDVADIIKKGTSYGVPTAIEVEMAKVIVEAYQGIDQVRMVNSGTEATMSALRVARGFTDRKKIVKFEGCYHGHSDSLLVKSGSGTITYGVPTSPGVPEEVVAQTLVAPYNDKETIEQIFKQYGEEIAAVIVEPIGGNMGVVPATKDFLQTLRHLTSKYQSVLIFDEVITGFRIAYGSSPEYFGIVPDMVCFGKIIGAGLPVGAYGGNKKIMECVSPVGPVYQAGTLSGNPLAMYFGKRQLDYLKKHKELYKQLEEKGAYLEEGIQKAMITNKLPYTVNRVGSLVSLFFTDKKVKDFQTAITVDSNAFRIYFQSLLSQGILIGPSPYEAMFLSAAHTITDLDKTIEAIDIALQQVRQVCIQSV